MSSSSQNKSINSYLDVEAGGVQLTEEQVKSFASRLRELSIVSYPETFFTDLDTVFTRSRPVTGDDRSAALSRLGYAATAAVGPTLMLALALSRGADRYDTTLPTAASAMLSGMAHEERPDNRAATLRFGLKRKALIPLTLSACGLATLTYVLRPASVGTPTPIEEGMVLGLASFVIQSGVNIERRLGEAKAAEEKGE